MEFNWWIVPVAALIPMALGFVWYNESVFGKAWMKAAEMTSEKMNGANMMLIFGLSFVMSLLLSAGLVSSVIHQFGVIQLLSGVEGFGEEGTPVMNFFNQFVAEYGTMHRSFGHGALHGGVVGFFLALPVLATNALFERKGGKYILINAGYWIVCLILMGGVICEFM